MQPVEAVRAEFVYTTRDGVQRTYDSAAGFDLRISGDGIDRFAALIGFDLPSKAARLVIVAAAAKYRKERVATL